MTDLPTTMAAVLHTGHGGLDRLEYRTDVPVPAPRPGEVLIQVAAAAVNNTDVNTRIGWYSKSISTETGDGAAAGFAALDDGDATWGGKALTFPRIQGADVCGRVVDVGDGVPRDRIGERVLVRNMLRTPVDYRPFECWTFGSECDGGFAQFTVAPSRETYAVQSDWSDAELAAVPCAYSTAENMLHRAGVGAERVLVTGASGGVGLAAVQLAKRRGATVVAVCSAAKSADVGAQGADRTVDRHAALVDVLGRAHDLPQRPVAVRRHVPGGRRVRRPDRLRRARRGAAGGLPHVPPARDRARPGGLPQEGARRQVGARPARAALRAPGRTT